MEVKPGYKQTEVGVIPEEWEVARIANVADVKTGPFGSALHERDYVHDGTPIITVEHLGEFGVMHFNLPLVSDADRYRLRAYSLDVSDIVFSRVGSVDRNALIRETEAGWLFSGRLLRVRPNKKRAFAPYLSYHFHGESFKRRVRDVAVGQTMASLNTKILNNVTVVLPILPEQRAIATALSDVDALISGLDQLIAKKRDIKQASMQQLLTGQQRLPGFHGGWEVKQLGDLCKITTGSKDVNEGNPNGTFPFFTCSRSVTYSDTYSFDTEAILIAGNGDVGTRHYYKGRFEAYQRTYVLDRFQVDVRFIDQYLEKYLIQSLATDKIGSSIPYIKLGNLRDFEVSVPSDKSEVNAIVAVLSDMGAEIAALEARLAKTRALKQGMMQELLTGRTRLV